MTVSNPDAGDNSHFPCISTELMKWDNTGESNFHIHEDLELGTCLLRCRAKSSRELQAKSAGRLGRTESVSDSASSDSYSRSLFQPLSSGWQYLRYTWDMWCAPSETLIAYAHLRGRGCPWQIGYLLSETPNVSEICVITDVWMEAVQVSWQTRSLLATGSHTIEAERDVLKQLLDRVVTACGQNETETEFEFDTFPKSPVRRWRLSFVDPWPNWRCVVFNSRRTNDVDDSKTETDGRLAAIAYSNGSVEVINLSAATDGDEEPLTKLTKRARIFIPAPYCDKSIDPKSSLFPVVYMAFFGNNNLLVCHFRGHFDIWHLDWSAKRFPARLVTRVYPGPSLCYNPGVHTRGVNHTAILAADFDPQSCTLLLAGLPKRSGGLHDRLALQVYRLSQHAPFVPSLNKPDGEDCSFASLLLNQFHSSKVMIGHTLNRLLHVSPLPQQQDAVAFLQLNSQSPVMTAGVLHVSGSCSIWSLPELEPMCIVIGSDIPSQLACSPAPSDEPKRPNASRAFRFTWWNSKPEADGSCAQLAVLRENGELNVLEHTDTKTRWLTLPDHQLREIGLHAYAAFAYTDVTGTHDRSRTGELLLVDFGPSDGDSSSETADKANHTATERSIVRAIQLSSTTETGLFCHFIHSGRYEEAISLANRHHLDVELVYQQQWLHLAVQLPYLADFDNLIKSTLGLIKHRPLWVIQQCLSYLPQTSASSLVSSEQLFRALRSLLNHGLARVRALGTGNALISKDTVSLLERKLLQQLEHVDSVETFLSYACDQVFDTEHPPAVYDIRALVHSLRSFRRHALLDIAMEYAHAGQFRIVQQMLIRYPKSVGRYRLAIASSLPETVNPIKYVDLLLDVGFSTTKEEPPYAAQTELEKLAVERLQMSCEEFSEPLEDGISPMAYAERLATWLICRARAIDAQTGLTSYALSLIELGGSICWKIFRRVVDDDQQLATSLFILRRLRWDLALLTEIVYGKPRNVDESTNATRATVVVYSKSKPIVLARFRLNELQRLTVEDRLDMLLQLRLNKSSSEAVGADRSILEKRVVAVWQLVISYSIHYSGSSFSKSFNDLVTYCMLRIAAMLGLGALQCLVALQADAINGAVKLIGDENHWWSNTDSSSSIPAVPFLTSLLHVIQKHEPPVKSETPSNGLRSYSQDLTKLGKLMNSYVNSLKKASSGDRTALRQISDKLRLLDRCAVSVVQFCDLVSTVERHLGRPVPVGFKSVGQLMDASHNGSAFRQLLAHWMAVATSLAQHEDVTTVTDSSVAELEKPATQLTEILTHLHDILKTLFIGSQAERWLSLGFQFSLLAAGNARLFSVSKTLHLNEQSRALGSDQSSLFICLLLALRTYVDASAPASFNLHPTSARSHPSHMDPNERLARYCLEFFRASHSSPVPALIEAFELEEQLLNVASYLTEVRQATDTQLLDSCPILPRQLRPLWLESDRITVQRRQAVFLTSLNAILAARVTSRRSKRLVSFLEPQNLIQIGQLFRLTPVETAVCFLQIVHTHVASSKYEWHTDELMPRALSMLTTAVHSKDPLYWFVCAQWAGYGLDERLRTTTILTDERNLLPTDSSWTCLHALYGIGPHSSNLSTHSTERVERFRVCLAQFALAYCPIKHATQLFALLAVAMHRTAYSQSLQKTRKRDSLTAIKSVSKTLGHLIREHWSPSRSFDDEQSVTDHLPMKHVPYIYLSLDSVETDSLIASITGNAARQSPEELALWMIYLEACIARVSAPSSVAAHHLDLSCIRTVFVDTRLSLAFASLHSCFPNFESTTSLMTFLERLDLLSPCEQITFAGLLNHEHAVFAQRLKLLLGVCALPFDDHQDVQLSPAGCFPLGTVSLRALRTSSSPWLQRWSCEAVFSCLAQRLKAILPHVDLALFDSDYDYRVEVVLRISRTRLPLALRLALFGRVSIEECLYARITALLVDMQAETKKQQTEVRSILSWLCHFPNGQNRFIQWSEMAIYPRLMTITSLKFYFELLSEVPDSPRVANLSVHTHQKILSALEADKACLELFNSPSYAKFLCQLLLHSDESEGEPQPLKVLASYREHMLYPHINSKSMVNVLKKILSILASSDCRTTLTAEDLFAMCSLHALDDHVESADVRSQVSSSLPAITSGDSDSQSCLRLTTWLADVLFSRQSKRFTVEQRRSVLSETVSFLKKRLENRSRNSSEWQTVFDRVVGYQSQLDRVIKQLSAIQFPPCPAEENQMNDTVEFPSGFYSSFLTVRPDQPDAAIELIRQLVHAVCADHSACSDHTQPQPNTRCVSEKLQWFCDHLSSCLRALDVKTEAALQVMVEAVASLIPSSVSALEIALSKLAPETRPSPDSSVDFGSLYVRFVKSAALSVPGDSARSTQLRLFGAMLANERIRRSQGPRLVPDMLHALEAGEDRQTVSLVFRSAIQAVCDTTTATVSDAAVDNLKDEIDRVMGDSRWATDPCSNILPPIESFIKAKISEFSGESDDDSCDRPAMSKIYQSIELVQAVVELTLLLLCPGDCVTELQQTDTAVPAEQVKLWSVWLEFGIRCNVFTTSEAARWLLHQWTNYGSPPPRGLAHAGLLYLKTLVSSDETKDSDQPMFPASLLLAICLCQPHEKLVRDTLHLLTALSPFRLERTIDADVCLYFVCLHGPLWPQLVTTSAEVHKQGPSVGSCPSLFTRVMQSLEHRVPDLRADQRSTLVRHCLQLLRQANLWIEAARLCRLVTGVTRDLVSVTSLVGLVRELTKK